MKKDLKLYWTLFITTFSLSAFTFGGGFVIVPLMKKRFVDKLKWIDEDEMLNLIAIGINCYIGLRRPILCDCINSCIPIF
jgi:chromate transporter